MVNKDGTMEQSKPDDKGDRGEARPYRILGRDEGEVTDVRSIAGHAYKVVYAQKSLWVFYMRLDKLDGEGDRFVQIVFGPCDCGCGGRPIGVGWGGKPLNY